MSSRTGSSLSYRSSVSSKNVLPRHATVRHPQPPSKPLSVPVMVERIVSNLRLMNLSTLKDCPQITPELFSSVNAIKNQKARIKAVEWILFQLFQLWNPVRTKDKLQPFFPPGDSIQSINLRAALFRYLDELRQQQVLPRDLILRKSMLDDCKGEKVLEILLAFSTVLLQKIDSSAKPALGRETPLASELAKPVQANVVPLTLVYKNTISNLVLKEEKINKTVEDLQRQCVENNQKIEARLEAATRALEDLKRGESMALSDDLSELKGQFRAALRDDPHLFELVFRGEKHTQQDQRLARQWSETWDEAVTGEKREKNTEPIGGLERLQEEVEEQIQTADQSEKCDPGIRGAPEEIKKSLYRGPKPQATPSVCFSRHQHLTVRRQPNLTKGGDLPVEATLPQAYRTILADLSSSLTPSIPSARRLHLSARSSSSDRQLTRRHSAQQRERQIGGQSQQQHRYQTDRQDSSRPPPPPSSSSSSTSISPTKTARFPIRPVATSTRPTSTAAAAPTAAPSPPSVVSKPPTQTDKGLRPLSLVSAPSTFLKNDVPGGKTRKDGPGSDASFATINTTATAFPPFANIPNLSHQSRAQDHSTSGSGGGALTLSERTRLSMTHKNMETFGSSRPGRKESHQSVGTEGDGDQKGGNRNGILEEDGEGEQQGTERGSNVPHNLTETDKSNPEANEPPPSSSSSSSSDLLTRTRLSMSGVSWGVPGNKGSTVARRQSIRGTTGLSSTARRKTGSFTSRLEHADEERSGRKGETYVDPEMEEAFKSRPRVAISPVGSSRLDDVDAVDSSTVEDGTHM